MHLFGILIITLIGNVYQSAPSLSASTQRIVFALLLTSSFYFLLLNNFWGLGALILQTFFAFAFLSAKQNIKNKSEILFYNRGEILFYLISAIGLSIFLALRNFEPGRFLTILSILGLNTVASVRASSEGLLTVKTTLIGPIVVTFRSFVGLSSQLGGLFLFLGSALGKKQVSSKKSGGILFGAILAIILVVIFLVLFSGADPIFGKYVFEFLSSLPPWGINPSRLLAWLQILFVFGFFGALLSSFKLSENEFSTSVASSFKFPVTIAVCAVSVVTALFLIVQAQYLFAGQELLQELGISYSEYTRRGFAQLVVVSVISLVLLWFLIRKPQGEKDNPVIRLLSYTFLFEVLLILASAFRRVYLYQAEHGFTQARLLGIVFAIWLGGILFIFLANLMGRLKSQTMPFAGLVNTVFTIFILNFINIDHLVGAVKQPNLGYRIDHPYIVRALSEDAWIGWKKTLEFYEVKCLPDSGLVMINLSAKYSKLQKQREKQKGLKALGAWNLSKQKAFDFLDKNLGRINKVKSCYQIEPPSPIL